MSNPIATVLGIPKSPNTDTVYYAFGRFQPPTIGHRKVFDTMKALAAPTAADYFIVPSETCDALVAAAASATTAPAKRKSACKKGENPLRLEDKLDFLVKMYPADKSHLLNIATLAANYKALMTEAQLEDIQQTFSIPTPGVTIPKSFVTVSYALFISGYKKVFLVVGSDEYDKLTGLAASIHKILSEDLKEKGYDFKLVNAGKRLESKDDIVAGMSGTKMRRAASDCNFDAFVQGIPEVSRTFNIDDRRSLFYKLRRGLLPPAKDVFADCNPEGLERPHLESLLS